MRTMDFNVDRRTGYERPYRTVYWSGPYRSVPEQILRSGIEAGLAHANDAILKSLHRDDPLPVPICASAGKHHDLAQR